MKAKVHVDADLSALLTFYSIENTIKTTMWSPQKGCP
jgi:hypothetical protein